MVSSPLRLHVLDADAGWQEVPTVEGALLVLAGEMLQHWSGHRWTAAEHRIAPGARAPGAGSTGAASAASEAVSAGVAVEYAHNADMDAVLTPIETPHSRARGLRPTPAGQFLRRG